MRGAPLGEGHPGRAALLFTVTTLALQADGKIVAVGGSGHFGDLFAVVRLDGDGTLDAAFGRDGRVTWDFGPYGAAATSVAIQADGKIIPAGTWTVVCWEGGHCDTVFVLARYFVDGSPDPTFGGDGEVSSDFKGWPMPSHPSHGRIVVADEISGGFTLARYNSDASADTSFSGDGRVRTFPRYSNARSVLIQNDGEIVLAGTVFSADGSPGFALVDTSPCEDQRKR